MRAQVTTVAVLLAEGTGVPRATSGAGEYEYDSKPALHSHDFLLLKREPLSSFNSYSCVLHFAKICKGELALSGCEFSVSLGGSEPVAFVRLNAVGQAHFRCILDLFYRFKII